MAGKADKVAAVIKAGGTTAKKAAVKVHDLATDPVVQAKARKLADTGAKIYRAANTPEAKEAYRRAVEFLKKTRGK